MATKDLESGFSARANFQGNHSLLERPDKEGRDSKYVTILQSWRPAKKLSLASHCWKCPLFLEDG